MALTIKYTKSQYLSKITELEGYYAQLETHLNRMSELKEQMFNFWNDEKAQKAGLILNSQIRQVKSTMDQVSSSLIFYKSTVEKLDGADINALDLIEGAISMINSLM